VFVLILNFFQNCDEVQISSTVHQVQTHHTHFECTGFSHLKCILMFTNTIHKLWIYT